MDYLINIHVEKIKRHSDEIFLFEEMIKNDFKLKGEKEEISENLIKDIKYFRLYNYEINRMIDKKSKEGYFDNCTDKEINDKIHILGDEISKDIKNLFY